MTLNAFIERAALMLPEPLRHEVKLVFAHGAQKHSTVQGLIPQCKHALKHACQGLNEEREEESGLPHNAHVAARNILALYVLAEKEGL